MYLIDLLTLELVVYIVEIGDKEVCNDFKEFYGFGRGFIELHSALSVISTQLIQYKGEWNDR